MKKKKPAPRKKAPPPSASPAQSAPGAANDSSEDHLRQKHYQEYQQLHELQQRRMALRERHPSLYSRLTILENLVVLQNARGGHFPPKVVFVHMPDYILNVRRIGQLDVGTLAVSIEVYEHNDILPGIVWLPLDHIWWAGTTDIPLDSEQAGLRARKLQTEPVSSEYQALRLKLAGLDFPEAAGGSHGGEAGDPGDDPAELGEGEM